jgi:hypothetical protein
MILKQFARYLVRFYYTQYDADREFGVYIASYNTSPEICLHPW